MGAGFPPLSSDMAPYSDDCPKYVVNEAVPTENGACPSGEPSSVLVPVVSRLDPFEIRMAPIEEDAIDVLSF
jgi:hypothetical protein